MRGLLCLSALVLGSVPFAQGAENIANPAAQPYHLRFFHTHTGERLDVIYRVGDQYVPEALNQLDHFLRDHRTGDIHHYDPRLFDLLNDLIASVGPTGSELQVICVYRTPWSNHFYELTRRAWRFTACIWKRRPSTSVCLA